MRLSWVIIWSCCTSVSLNFTWFSIPGVIRLVIALKIRSESMKRLSLSIVSSTELKPLLCQTQRSSFDQSSWCGNTLQFILKLEFSITPTTFLEKALTIFSLDNESSNLMVKTNFVIHDVNKVCIWHYGSIPYCFHFHSHRFHLQIPYCQALTLNYFWVSNSIHLFYFLQTFLPYFHFWEICYYCSCVDRHVLIICESLSLVSIFILIVATFFSSSLGSSTLHISWVQFYEISLRTMETETLFIYKP